MLEQMQTQCGVEMTDKVFQLQWHPSFGYSLRLISCLSISQMPVISQMPAHFVSFIVNGSEIKPVVFFHAHLVCGFRDGFVHCSEGPTTG